LVALKCLLDVFFSPFSEALKVLFVSVLHLILHILLEHKLHFFRLFLYVLIAQTPFKQVPCLLQIALSMLDLHVHVDCPHVHALGVVGHDAFEHSSSLFGVAVLELKLTEFGN
jgi:hypothetical protein